MRIFTSAKKFNIFGGNEAGVSLIEAVIALALLGLIAASFLGGLATGSKGTVTADEQATAESLVRSEMEYVKSQAYIDYSANPHDVYSDVAPPTDYSINLTAEPFDQATGIAYGQTGGIYDQDDGIQKITVTAKRNGNSLLTIADYKVDR